MNLDRLLAFFRALQDEAVDYVLVGGFALNMIGLTRATEDADIVIRLTEENVRRLRAAFRRVWDDPAIEEIQYHALAGDFPAITYGPPDEVFTVDIVARFDEAFRFEDLKAELKDWQSVKVCVATPRTLYEMKKATIRPVDRSDAAELAERFGFRED